MNRPLLTPPRRRASDDHLIPLINIVFLLLIFFMIAGRISTDHSAGVQLPQTQSANAEAQIRELELVLTRQGELRLNGQTLTVGELPDALLALNLDVTHSRIALKADAEALGAQLNPVLRQLRAAGWQHVALYTQRGLDS